MILKSLIVMLKKGPVVYDFTNITVVFNLKYCNNKNLNELNLLKPVKLEWPR